MTGPDWQRLIPDIGAGLMVMCLGLLEIFNTPVSPARPRRRTSIS